MKKNQHKNIANKKQVIKNKQKITPKKSVPTKKQQIESKSNLFDKKSLFLIGGILMLIVIAFIPVLDAEFTNWDDNWYITENPYVLNLSIDNIGELFTSYYKGQYSPLTTLTLAIDYKLFGLSPFAFHLNCLLMHLINTVLVFWFVIILLRQNTKYKDNRNLQLTIAVIAAVFFGVHTLQVESVAWLSARKIVLYSIFFFASLISYLKYFETKKIKYYIISIALFALSFLSKEQAVMLSIVLIAIDIYLNRKLLDKTLIFEKIPFLALSIIFGIVTLYASQSQANVYNFQESVVSERFLWACYALTEYLFKFILPINLSNFYPSHEVIKSFSMLFAFYLLTVIAFSIGLIYSFKRNRLLTFGILFFLLNIFLPIALQVATERSIIIADRYLYVPIIGLLLVVGEAYSFLSSKYKISRILQAVLAVCIITLSILTYNRSKVWNNSLALWNDVIEKYDDVYLLYYRRGNVYLEAGKIKEAMTNYNSAIKLNPKYGDACANRGIIKGQQGDMKGAIADFNIAIEVDPKRKEAYSNRGNARSALGNLDSAITDYNKAIKLDSKYYDALVNRAYALRSKKDWQAAIIDYTNAIAIKPTPTLYTEIGFTRYMNGNPIAALKDIDKAIKSAPNFGYAYLLRGRIKAKQGLIEDACNDFKQATKLGDKNANKYISHYCTNSKK